MFTEDSFYSTYIPHVHTAFILQHLHSSCSHNIHFTALAKLMFTQHSFYSTYIAHVRAVFISHHLQSLCIYSHLPNIHLFMHAHERKSSETILCACACREFDVLYITCRWSLDVHVVVLDSHFELYIDGLHVSIMYIKLHV